MITAAILVLNVGARLFASWSGLQK
jgi:hypothetical protein